MREPRKARGQLHTTLSREHAPHHRTGGHCWWVIFVWFLLRPTVYHAKLGEWIPLSAIPKHHNQESCEYQFSEVFGLTVVHGNQTRVYRFRGRCSNNTPTDRYSFSSSCFVHSFITPYIGVTDWRLLRTPKTGHNSYLIGCRGTLEVALFIVGTLWQGVGFCSTN